MSFAAQTPYVINSMILLGSAGIPWSNPSDHQTIFFRYPSCAIKVSEKACRESPWREHDKSGHNQTEAEAKFPNQADSQRLTRPECVAKQTSDVPAIVQWQLEHLQGFVHNLIKAIQHGPLMDQLCSRKEVCDIIRGRSSGRPASDQFSSLHNSDILAIFGDSDGNVVAKGMWEDLGQPLGGPEYSEVQMAPGSHGFLDSSSDELVKHILKFLKLEIVD